MIHIKLALINYGELNGVGLQSVVDDCGDLSSPHPSCDVPLFFWEGVCVFQVNPVLSYLLSLKLSISCSDLLS